MTTLLYIRETTIKSPISCSFVLAIQTAPTPTRKIEKKMSIWRGIELQLKYRIYTIYKLNVFETFFFRFEKVHFTLFKQSCSLLSVTNILTCNRHNMQRKSAKFDLIYLILIYRRLRILYLFLSSKYEQRVFVSSTQKQRN